MHNYVQIVVQIVYKILSLKTLKHGVQCCSYSAAHTQLFFCMKINFAILCFYFKLQLFFSDFENHMQQCYIQSRQERKHLKGLSVKSCFFMFFKFMYFQFRAALLQRWDLPPLLCNLCPFFQILSVCPFNNLIIVISISKGVNFCTENSDKMFIEPKSRMTQGFPLWKLPQCHTQITVNRLYCNQQDTDLFLCLFVQ